MAEAPTRQVGGKTYALQLVRELTDPAGAFAIRFYHGTDADQGRPVAIQEMVALGQDDRGLDFLDRAGSKAHHLAELGELPNLAALYDMVETPNRIWLVFERPEGATLAETPIRPGSPPPNEQGIALGIEIALDICEGLALLHQKGLAHRDLSPRSITAGRPSRLFSFVLAALPSRETYHSGIPSPLSYRAPEQNPSQDALSLPGPPADIYALGALLYYLVTAKPPPIRLPSDSPPMPIDLNPIVPVPLQAIIGDCLAYNAEQRPSIEEVRQALQEIQKVLGPSAAARAPEPEKDWQDHPLVEHFNQGLPEPPTFPPTPSPWQPQLVLPEGTARRRAMWTLLALGSLVLTLVAFAILLLSRIL